VEVYGGRAGGEHATDEDLRKMAEEVGETYAALNIRRSTSFTTSVFIAGWARLPGNPYWRPLWKWFLDVLYQRRRKVVGAARDMEESAEMHPEDSTAAFALAIRCSARRYEATPHAAQLTFELERARRIAG